MGFVVVAAAPPSVISDVHSVSGQSVYSSHPSTVATAAAATTNPEALYAMQQMQRIKAATACQIINNRVVEAIRQQQELKLHEKEMRKKFDPNWRDPNETNPNNAAYKGPQNAKFVKRLARKKKNMKKMRLQNEKVATLNHEVIPDFNYDDDVKVDYFEDRDTESEK